MQPDAEHQEDDTKFRQLADGFQIAHKPRREGANGHSGEQIADNRGQPKSACQYTADEGGEQRGGQGREQIGVIHESAPETNRQVKMLPVLSAGAIAERWLSEWSEAIIARERYAVNRFERT